MRAELVRPAGIETAEVKEPQRHTINQIAATVDGQVPPVEIPIGDVVTGILEDRVLEETRHEVDPALVGEHVARHVRQRVAASDLPPPIEERPRRLTNRDEPQIVDAGSKDEEPVDLEVVARERLHRVRSQNDAMLFGQSRHVVERRVDCRCPGRGRRQTGVLRRRAASATAA